MPWRIDRLPQSELDLAGLSEYIARDNPDAALRFVDAAERSLQKLADMPELGGAWESAHPRLAGVRVWPIPGFENYLIFIALSAELSSSCAYCMGHETSKSYCVGRPKTSGPPSQGFSGCLTRGSSRRTARCDCRTRSN